MGKVHKKRHILKTITWRVIASTTTFILAKLFGLSLEKAMYVAVTESILKMLFYYLHEIAWYKSSFGVTKDDTP